MFLTAWLQHWHLARAAASEISVSSQGSPNCGQGILFQEGHPSVQHNIHLFLSSHNFYWSFMLSFFIFYSLLIGGLFKKGLLAPVSAFKGCKTIYWTISTHFILTAFKQTVYLAVTSHILHEQVSPHCLHMDSWRNWSCPSPLGLEITKKQLLRQLANKSGDPEEGKSLIVLMAREGFMEVVFLAGSCRGEGMLIERVRAFQAMGIMGTKAGLSMLSSECHQQTSLTDDTNVGQGRGREWVTG